MARTREDILKDLREHPERHSHNFEELTACCTIDGVIDVSLMEAHSQYVKFGTNSGVHCDVSSGPCACGAWH